MRFFIACPANIATGGTELLHQFCQCLNKNGTECYMVYVNGEKTTCPTPEQYMKYNVKYVTKYVDSEASVLVLAETQVHHVNLCVRGTVMLWWLSVDNYVDSYRHLFGDGDYDFFHLRERNNVVHFVQSHYAKDFLGKEMCIPESRFLGDYINDEIAELAGRYRHRMKRENICLYNPRKGYEVLRPVIEACRKDIRWIPLDGLTPDRMAATMCMAKVYVDFGEHPGRDRIPREAAVCGCCVVTNRRGSARYEEDVMLPEEYKLEDTEDIQGALQVIYDLIEHYEERKAAYEAYVHRIEGEKAAFEQDVQDAVAVLARKMEEKSKEVAFESGRYQEISGSLRYAIEKFHELSGEAETMYDGGNPGKAVDRLLTADYVLQLLRETIWAEIEDMA